MKVILSGGGSGEQTKELDSLFANFLDKSKPLLYVPLAIDNIKHPYPDCLIWLKSTFDKLNVSKYEMVTEDNISSFKEKDPKKFSGIYIGGGNTFYLMKQLKKSKFWNFLMRAIKLDIPVYGGSAGAIILSKSLIPAKYADKNWVGLKNLKGANLTKGYNLICHYSEKEKKKVEFILKNEELKLILLTEQNGLYNDGVNLTLIGKDIFRIISLNGEKKLESGQKLI